MSAVNVVAHIQIAPASFEERMAIVPLLGEFVLEIPSKLLYLGDGETVGGNLVMLDETVIDNLLDIIRTETADRIAGDEALGIRIDDEAAARALAELQIRQLITDEAQTRSDVDEALDTLIRSETADRIAAIQEVYINIGQVNGELFGLSLIQAETAARETADTLLQDNINQETEDRNTDIESLNTMINQVVEGYESGDSALGVRIDDEANARNVADEALGDRISAETDDRNEGEIALSNRIDAETADRELGEVFLNTLITAESTTREEEVVRLEGVIATKANTADLAEVAFSGSFTDLINVPPIDPQVNADWTATSGPSQILNKPTLGTAAAANVGDFATAAEGDLAVSAVQPEDLSVVATTGSYNDLSDKPTFPVQSVNGKTGAVVITKADVGLGNADNTSDIAKPLSSAAQTAFTAVDVALDTKANTADLATVATTGSYNDLTDKPAIGDDAVQSVNGKTGIVTIGKADVGLSNVDNTSDALKPISTATQTALNAKADQQYVNAQLLTKVDESDLAPVATSGSYNDLTDKPTVIGQVNSDWNATSGSAEILNKPTTIDGYGIVDAVSTADIGVTVPNLIDGLIPTSQIPPIAITDTYVVDSEVEMLALDVQKGDIAVRSDISKSYINTSGINGDMSDWTELLAPPNAVQSVNGKVGALVLSKGDVGLGSVDNTSDMAKPVSTPQQTALNLKANAADLASVATSGNYDDLINKPAIVQPPVSSVNGKTGNVVLVKGDIGLGNVDNTSDLLKPISTATQTALDEKADSASLATVATSGSFNDLSDKPAVPPAQVPSDWEATAGVSRILNKPVLGSAASASTSDFATAASGELANTAVQPGQPITVLNNTAGYTTNTGTVTSIGVSVPTGLTVSGAAITTSGVFGITWASGYVAFTTTQSSKLAGIAAGAQVNVATNLELNRTDTYNEITNSNGSNVTLNSAQPGLAGLMSGSDKTKLDGFSSSSFVPSNAQLYPGGGLIGGGMLSSNPTISMGTPSTITLTSTNNATGNSHTHNFAPGGDATQYIRGDGALTTFPTIPDTNGFVNTTANQSGIAGNKDWIGQHSFNNGARGRLLSVVLNSTVQLSATHMNIIVKKTNNNNVTWTLTNNLGADDDTITLVNASNTGTVSISGNGANLYVGGSLANPHILNPRTTLTVVRTATNIWQG